ISPELARRTRAGPPPLIFPASTPDLWPPETAIVTGRSLRTFPPLVFASRSTAADLGRAALMPPPATARRQSLLGEVEKFTSIEPLLVSAVTASRASATLMPPPATARRQSLLGEGEKFPSIEPLLVSAVTASRASATLMPPPALRTVSLPTAKAIT